MTTVNAPGLASFNLRKLPRRMKDPGPARMTEAITALRGPPGL